MQISCRTENSLVSVKLPLLPNQENEDAPWLQRNAPPVPVTQQIVQGTKSLYPADRDPAVAAQTPVVEPLPFPGCRAQANLAHSACELNIGMTFQEQAGDSNLFVQIVAHIAAAAVPHSFVQYFRSGQVTPLAKPTGGHRPLHMMSFLRRTCSQVSHGYQERIGGRMCWLPSIWCWVP